MVKNRLTLINNYVKLHCLLGTSKTLNTNDSQIKCNKVKDITMNYQQDTKNSCHAHASHLFCKKTATPHMHWLRHSTWGCKARAALHPIGGRMIKFNASMKMYGFVWNPQRLRMESSSIFIILIRVFIFIGSTKI